MTVDEMIKKAESERGVSLTEMLNATRKINNEALELMKKEKIELKKYHGFLGFGKALEVIKTEAKTLEVEIAKYNLLCGSKKDLQREQAKVAEALKIYERNAVKINEY